MFAGEQWLMLKLVDVSSNLTSGTRSVNLVLRLGSSCSQMSLSACSPTGHDTTASAICWSLYNLARHDHYQEKCRKEVMDLMEGRDVHEINWWENTARLQHLTANGRLFDLCVLRCSGRTCPAFPSPPCASESPSGSTLLSRPSPGGTSRMWSCLEATRSLKASRMSET